MMLFLRRRRRHRHPIPISIPLVLTPLLTRPSLRLAHGDNIIALVNLIPIGLRRRRSRAVQRVQRLAVRLLVVLLVGQALARGARRDGAELAVAAATAAAVGQSGRVVLAAQVRGRGGDGVVAVRGGGCGAVAGGDPVDYYCGEEDCEEGLECEVDKKKGVQKKEVG